MYGTASLPDGQIQVKSPLVLGDTSTETELESVSALQLALDEQVSASLGPTRDLSVVSGTLSVRHNTVSPVLSDVDHVKGSLGGPD